jgi:outer membrane protein OmpA-like peptidoglycan-associated protein
MKKRFMYILVFLIGVSSLAFAQDFKLEATLTGNVGEIQNIRFSPDGRLLAGGEQFGNVLIWNTKTKNIDKTLKFHNKRVLEVTFNKTGTLLASSCEDGTVGVWDTKTWNMVANFRSKAFLSFDGRELVSASFVVFSPDSKYVYFGGDNGYIMKGQIPDKSGVLKPAESIFSTNYEDGRWYGTITGGCLSADEKYLVISVGHLVDFIDLRSEILAKFYRYDEGYLNDVVVGPLPNSVATWSDDGKVNIWINGADNKGEIASSFQVTTPGNYSGASFSRDSRYLVSSASGTVAKIWDMGNGRQIGTLSSHTRIVRISRFSPAENMVATASYDGSVKLWKDKTEPPLEEILASKTEPKKEEIIKVEETKPVKVEETKPVVVETPKKDILKDAKIEEIKEGDVIQLENILFVQSKAILLTSSYDEVDKLIAFMKKYPTVRIELSGHTDNVGVAARNQALSEQRVRVIKNRLVMNKIDESRIETVAYGGTKPIADNSTEAGRQKNRRVEMKILKK